jgi:hypothetical protein
MRCLKSLPLNPSFVSIGTLSKIDMGITFSTLAPSLIFMFGECRREAGDVNTRTYPKLRLKRG